jgi:uncharacterized protein
MRRGCKYWLRLSLFGLAAFVVIFLPVWEYEFVDFMTKPAPSAICCKTPADSGLAYRSISFPSPDGFPLAGWYIPTHNGAVVLMLHGYGANRTELLERAVVLAKAGFGVLLYDLRGHGESGGVIRAMGWPDTKDVQAAVDFARQLPGVDRDRIGIFGFSIGGQIALRAAAEDKRLHAIFVDDPSYTRIEDIPAMPNPLDDFEARGVTRADLALISMRTGVPIPAGTTKAISEIAPRPIFMISSGKTNMSRVLEDYLFSLAGNPKDRLEIIEADHGGTFLARREEYASKLVGFFTQWLLLARE